MTKRWNIEEQPDGDLLICKGDHERHEGCEPEHYIPKWKADGRHAALRLCIRDAAHKAGLLNNYQAELTDGQLLELLRNVADLAAHARHSAR